MIKLDSIKQEDGKSWGYFKGHLLEVFYLSCQDTLTPNSLEVAGYLYCCCDGLDLLLSKAELECALEQEGLILEEQED